MTGSCNKSNRSSKLNVSRHTCDLTSVLCICCMDSEAVLYMYNIRRWGMEGGRCQINAHHWLVMSRQDGESPVICVWSIMCVTWGRGCYVSIIDYDHVYHKMVAWRCMKKRALGIIM